MKSNRANGARPERREQDAFTFTDLLVVLGVMSLLALLSLTALAHNQPSSDRAICANNLRRLMQAWQMYADDYSGSLMANSSTPPAIPWVGGLDEDCPGCVSNTDPSKLTNSVYSQIGPYVKSSSLFRCPANSTMVSVAGIPRLKVRSYSMNSYMGTGAATWSPNFQVMVKMSEVSQPDRVFVLLEEHPYSIDDGSFALDLQNVVSAARIISYPAHFHLGGINLGMADGHVEYWQWSDARTMPPVSFNNSLPLNVASPNNPDVARLQAAASYLK